MAYIYTRSAYVSPWNVYMGKLRAYIYTNRLQKTNSELTLILRTLKHGSLGAWARNLGKMRHPDSSLTLGRTRCGNSGGKVTGGDLYELCISNPHYGHSTHFKICNSYIVNRTSKRCSVPTGDSTLHIVFSAHPSPHQEHIPQQRPVVQCPACIAQLIG